jgi:hypothetical protein
MKVKLKLNDFLNYLSFWNDKSDDECIELATDEETVDAEQALLNMLDRDFCRDFCREFSNEIKTPKQNE